MHKTFKLEHHSFLNQCWRNEQQRKRNVKTQVCCPSRECAQWDWKGKFRSGQFMLCCITFIAVNMKMNGSKFGKWVKNHLSQGRTDESSMKVASKLSAQSSKTNRIGATTFCVHWHAQHDNSSASWPVGCGADYRQTVTRTCMTSTPRRRSLENQL